MSYYYSFISTLLTVRNVYLIAIVREKTQFEKCFNFDISIVETELSYIYI